MEITFLPFELALALYQSFKKAAQDKDQKTMDALTKAYPDFSDVQLMEEFEVAACLAQKYSELKKTTLKVGLCH